MKFLLWFIFKQQQGNNKRKKKDGNDLFYAISILKKSK